MAATKSAAGIGAARRAPPLRARAGGARARSPPLPPPAAPHVRRSARVRAGARDDTDVEELHAGAAEADATDGAQSTELLLWVGGAALFGAGIFAVQGADPAAEFFAGYVLEQALSVDNLFVFILVFSYFKVPPAAQEVALKYGIVGAAVLRGVFVLAGAAVLERFEGALGVFALILIYSSYKLLTEEEDEDESLEDNALVKLCSKYIDTVPEFDGTKFFTTLSDGARAATPLLLATAVIELSDVVFAVDSIPAVFGVTRDPFIVYTSNIFAILSLRALFSFVQGALAELRYLQPAVAVVLGFIGAKMLADLAGYHIDTTTSLAVVAGLVGTGAGASLLLPEEDDEA